MIARLIKNRAAVYLAVICIVGFGSMQYASLPRESFPDVDIPVVLVTTPYIGVSPEDIEGLITVPLENELSGIKDVKKMSSTSAEGASIITLEFEPEVVIEDVIQRVRDRVNRAKPDLPEDAEDTDIREVSFADFPILIITIAGDLDEEVLKKLGEDLEEDLGRIDGVLEAKLAGGRTRQIRVQINPNRLAHYGLSLNQVVEAVQQENVNIPGGDVSAGAANFLVRIPGEFSTPQEIESVAIKRIGDSPVFIRDVATVLDDFADRDSYARVNGERAVTVSVTKRSGANVLDLADKAKEVASRHAEGWPEAVTWRVVGDQSRDIADMVNELENNVITALILVVGVILFFMGARNSLFVAMAIPLSMLIAIIVIAAFCMTLNMMVLFSLILGLGMLVDNGIVLVENIYRHVEEGENLFDASVNGTREVGWAVAASTATTVAAFAPLIFWKGIMGQFMGYLPKTVVAVLLASLVVAIVVLPVLTGRFMKRSRKAQKALDAQTSKAAASSENSPPQSRIMAGYQRVLEMAIDRRYIVAFMGLLLLVGTFMAYGALNHGTEFFPDVEPDRGTVSVRAPDGTDVEETDRIMRQVERILARYENVDFYVAETGVSGGGAPMEGAQSASNQGRITVDFLPHHTKAKEGQTPRVEDPRETIQAIRQELALIPGAELEIEKQREGPPVGAPIAVEISGNDFHVVGQLAAQVRRELAKVPGTTDLSDDYRVGRPEMRLRIDRGAAKRIGASTQEIAGTIRTAVAGNETSTLRDGKDEYDIIVELAPAYRNNLQAITALRVPGRQDRSPDTYSVPLSSVASYRLAGGSGSIRHIDQDLVVTISGDVKEGFNENAVRQGVEAKLAEIPATPGTFMRLGGAQDEQQESQEFLGQAFLIAVFLIAIILVAQFNRFDLPLIILASVVLSLIGVLWGLIITGTPFGIIMTGIGVISLAGVVVNNAIVLLDYVQQLRDQGMDVRTALLRAGTVRFRPVMLTATTTILGLVPMAIGLAIDFANFEFITGSQSAQWWGPMAVAIIFGLAFATLLTLFMVPTMYSILEDLRAIPAKIFPGTRKAKTSDKTP